MNVSPGGLALCLWAENFTDEVSSRGFALLSVIYEWKTFTAQNAVTCEKLKNFYR